MFKLAYFSSRLHCRLISNFLRKTWHYNDVIMGALTSHITSLTIVYSTVYSGADQRKHQSSASLAFVWGIHRWPVNSPHKYPVTRKMFPFDDVIVVSRPRRISNITILWLLTSRSWRHNSGARELSWDQSEHSIESRRVVKPMTPRNAMTTKSLIGSRSSINLVGNGQWLRSCRGFVTNCEK